MAGWADMLGRRRLPLLLATLVLAAGVACGGSSDSSDPVGDGADQYKENSPAAPDKTMKTGNAGNRVACGVIKQI